MSYSSRLILLTGLLLSPLAVPAQTIIHHRTTGANVDVSRDVAIRESRADVIVELIGQPSIRGGVSAAARRETFAQLRRDLAAIDPSFGKRGAESQIRFEYTTVFYGAALTVPEASLDAIARLSYVRSVRPDALMKAIGVPAQTDAAAVDAATRVNAHDLPTKGRGVTVAIIDSGIDYMHAALGGGFGPGFKVADGYDFVDNDRDPMDAHGHGTHVAGIVAANSPTLLGVAPEATLIAYRVLDRSGFGLTSGVIAAIERVADPNQDGDTSDHVDVVNLSLGGAGTPDDPAAVAVDNAVRAGVIVCVAAGNEGGLGTIGSPGSARLAITVGSVGAQHAVSVFSSRGPTRGTITFKPDVMAPGEDIVSSRLGGGVFAQSGTSMATPHVAGAAALLQALHRDWSPARMKAAFASTAIAVAGTPWERGAGRIDATRANAVTLSSNASGVTFGLVAANQGTTRESRTVTLTNDSNAAMTLTANRGVLPQGVTLDVQPATLNLAPGATADVTIAITVDNARLAYPDDRTAAGEVTFTGTRALALPWVILRAARTTVTFDGSIAIAEALRTDGTSEFLSPLDDHAAELIAKPGSRYDLVVREYFRDGAESGTIDSMRLIVREDLTMNGDQQLAIARAEAVHRIELGAVDDAGTPLASLPRVPGHSVYVSTLRSTVKKDRLDLSASIVTNGVRRIYATPVSDAYRFSFAQTYADLDSLRAYASQFPLLDGIRQSATLTTARAEYLRATVRSAGDPSILGICTATADTRLGNLGSWGSCVSRRLDEGTALQLFIGPDRTNDHHTALVATDATTVSPSLRAIGGKIVPTNDREPLVTSARLPNNSVITLGVGPLMPFVFPGTVGRYFFRYPYVGMYGPWGELNDYAAEGGRYALFDANGRQVEGGIISRFRPASESAPRHHLEIHADNFRAAGRDARGRIDVQFGANVDDLEAPTLTSLRIIDAAGNITDRLANGAAGTLTFSAADYDFQNALRSKPLSRVAVSWRVVDAPAWTALAITKSGSEHGSRADLGHLAAGDLYSADLSPLTSRHDSLLELRIEIDDSMGNHWSWIQTPAIAIGTPIATHGPKRRASR